MSKTAKPWTPESALDPAQYEPKRELPKRFVKWAEWRGIPAIPVYARWLRVDLSNHEALFQESGHHDTWQHVEVSFVHGLIPMYQKFTGNVYGDCNAMALRGHNVGPMVTHISVPPTNLLTGLHLLSSSCKWPISARRRLHRGESLCAFAWVAAPYRYCSEEKKKQQDQEDKPRPEAGSKSSSGKAESDGWPGALASGYGICMIPTGGKTVWMRLSIMDIILGVADMQIEKLVGKYFDKIWTGVKRFVNPATRAAAQKIAPDEAGKYIINKLLKKAGKDAVKGMALKFELGAPFKLASLNPNTGEVKIWTYTFGSWHPTSNAPLQPVEVLSEDPPAQPSPTSKEDEPSSNDPPAWWSDPEELAEPEPKPVEPAEPREPLGPYDPERTILDDFLEGVPHAW